MKTDIASTYSTQHSWLSCYKQIMHLGLPILVAHVIEALIPFINVKFAAQLGEIPLAASALVGSTFLAFMGFCWGVVVAIGIVAAQKIGGGKEAHKVGLVLWTGLILSILLSLPVMILFKNMDFFWNHLGQDPKVIEQAQQYINGLLFAVPADLAKFTIFQFAIACNQPRIPLMANIIGMPLLVLLNYFLVQKFGIYGIGLGTSITYGLITVGMLFFLLLNPYFRRYLIHAYHFKAFIRLIIYELKLGAPIGLMFSIELSFFMIVTLLMGYFGTAALAANQIAMQWLSLTVMLAFGFTESVTILVARAEGAKNHSLIMRITLMGALLALVLTLLIVLAYWFLPEWIIRVDLEKTEQNLPIFHLAVMMLGFCGVFQLIDSIRLVIAGALRGMGDSQYPMWVAVFGFWLVGLSVGYMCAFSLKMGAAGLWIGLIVGATAGTFALYRRILRLR